MDLVALGELVIIYGGSILVISVSMISATWIAFKALAKMPRLRKSAKAIATEIIQENIEGVVQQTVANTREIVELTRRQAILEMGVTELKSRTDSNKKQIEVNSDRYEAIQRELELLNGVIHQLLKGGAKSE